MEFMNVEILFLTQKKKANGNNFRKIAWVFTKSVNMRFCCKKKFHFLNFSKMLVFNSNKKKTLIFLMAAL